MNVFPFEISLLIGVLIVAIIPIYILILKKLKPVLQKSIPEQKSETKHRKGEKKDDGPTKRKQKPEQSTHSESECIHHFGYLGTLPKSASLPDECIRCSKALECLRSKKGKKNRRRKPRRKAPEEKEDDALERLATGIDIEREIKR